MSTPKLYSLLATAIAVSCFAAQAAFCQATTTLTDPLIPGQQSTLPFTAPADGAPPPVGSGSTPLPVTPGMSGPSTLLPWVLNNSSTDIDQSSSGIGLPVTPSIATPPGVLGPLLTPFIPPAPSTPGAQPNYLPPLNGYANPAQMAPGGVLPAGGLPGTGGYYSSINNVRRGGQDTVQYEERGRVSTLGGTPVTGSLTDNSQDDVYQFGPLAGFGVPYGVPTGNGYNNGVAGSNNDNRNSSIDLGGGQRTKIGGIVIPSGQSIQDYGASATRNNAIGALKAGQSTEFGQGFWREPITTSNTTDFGLPYKDFAQNAGVQAVGQLQNPNAVETNF